MTRASDGSVGRRRRARCAPPASGRGRARRRREAVRTVRDLLVDGEGVGLPHCPETPARGPGRRHHRAGRRPARRPARRPPAERVALRRPARARRVAHGGPAPRGPRRARRGLRRLRRAPQGPGRRPVDPRGLAAAQPGRAGRRRPGRGGRPRRVARRRHPGLRRRRAAAGAGRRGRAPARRAVAARRARGVAAHVVRLRPGARGRPAPRDARASRRCSPRTAAPRSCTAAPPRHRCRCCAPPAPARSRSTSRRPPRPGGSRWRPPSTPAPASGSGACPPTARAPTRAPARSCSRGSSASGLGSEALRGLVVSPDLRAGRAHTRGGPQRSPYGARHRAPTRRGSDVVTQQPRVPWQVKYLALVLIWGSSFLLMKVGLESMSAVQISALRILSGAAVISVLLLARGGRLPTGRAGVGPPVRLRVLPRGAAVHALRAVRDPDQLGAGRHRQRRHPDRDRARHHRHPAGRAGHRPPAGGRGRRASSASSRSCSPGPRSTGPTSSGSRWRWSVARATASAGPTTGASSAASTSAGLSQPAATLLTALVLMVPVVLGWAALQPEGLAAIWSYDAPGCRHVVLAAAGLRARARPGRNRLRLHAAVRRGARCRPGHRVDHHLPDPGGVGGARRASCSGSTSARGRSSASSSCWARPGSSTASRALRRRSSVREPEERGRRTALTGAASAERARGPPVWAPQSPVDGPRRGRQSAAGPAAARQHGDGHDDQPQRDRRQQAGGGLAAAAPSRRCPRSPLRRTRRARPARVSTACITATPPSTSSRVQPSRRPRRRARADHHAHQSRPSATSTSGAPASRTSPRSLAGAVPERNAT